MADDTFELLTRMYADFTLQFKEIKTDVTTLRTDIAAMKGDIEELKTDVTTLKVDIAAMKGDIRELKSDVTTLKANGVTMKGNISSLDTSVSKLGLKLENDTNKKIGLLLETRGEENRKLTVIENKIDILTKKVDRHDIEIKVIKAAK